MRPEGALPAPVVQQPPRPGKVVRSRVPVKLSSTGLPLAQCEFCKAEIVWVETYPNPRARTAEARRAVDLVPIDPEPSALTQANLVVTVRKEGRPQVGEMRLNQAAGYRASGGKTYIRHVRTCTKADELRRGVLRRHTR